MAGRAERALLEIYERLENHFGPTHWWPGETAFEVAVGAILTQNTAWTNVEKAIANLKRANLLSPESILAADAATLHDLLKPSGYFRVKTIRLQHFCRHLCAHYNGKIAAMAKRPLDALRAELLSINGIGPETADDILLYACGKPVFVVDAYTRRILSRHGLVEKDIDYESLRAYFERNLESDVQVFKEYHGLIVYTGKDFCRRAPKCEACPLGPMLKKGLPLL